jgi:hypothetical protein
MRRRWMVVVLVVVATASMGGYAFAHSGSPRSSAGRIFWPGRDLTVERMSVPGRLSVVVPAGWHVLRGWLSDVTDPAPRLAMGSFPARLSRRTCECGFPNVLNFPRNGAFIFVWEYLHYPRRQLARVPPRPGRISLALGRGVRLTCDGPNGGFSFKDAGRVFQVEVYLVPEAGPALRATAAAALDSLRVPVNA